MIWRRKVRLHLHPLLCHDVCVLFTANTLWVWIFHGSFIYQRRSSESSDRLYLNYICLKNIKSQRSKSTDSPSFYQWFTNPPLGLICLTNMNKYGYIYIHKMILYIEQKCQKALKFVLQLLSLTRASKTIHIYTSTSTSASIQDGPGTTKCPLWHKVPGVSLRCRCRYKCRLKSKIHRGDSSVRLKHGI